MIGEVLSESLWLLLIAQATVCITLGLAASFLLKRSAAKAHRVLLTALVAAVLTPGVYLLVRHFRLGVLVSEPTSVSHQATEPLISPDVPATSTFLTEVEYEPGPVIVSQEEDPRIPLPWGTICLVGWISLTTILLGRLTLRFALGLRLLAVAQPLDGEQLRQALESAVVRLGIHRPIRIRCSDKIKSPIIWCWTRQPVLLVHARASTRPEGVDWAGVFCAVNTTAETHLLIEGIIQNFDREKPPLEAQVQDLRSQMQGLQERMAQMQKLLGQFAEREKSSDKPQEMRTEY